MKSSAPQVQAADARIHLLASSQHQHRKIRVQHAHFFEHLLSILDRHIEIENGQVGQLLAKCLHCGGSILSHANLVTVGLQATAQEQPQRLVVFGDQ